MEVTRHLKTSGLHCKSCAALVDMTVGELEGVKNVTTDFSTAETVVTFDTDQLSEEDILQAVRSAGYEAELST